MSTRRTVNFFSVFDGGTGCLLQCSHTALLVIRIKFGYWVSAPKGRGLWHYGREKKNVSHSRSTPPKHESTAPTTSVADDGHWCSWLVFRNGGNETGKARKAVNAAGSTACVAHRQGSVEGMTCRQVQCLAFFSFAPRISYRFSFQRRCPLVRFHCHRCITNCAAWGHCSERFVLP